MLIFKELRRISGSVADGVKRLKLIMNSNYIFSIFSVFAVLFAAFIAIFNPILSAYILAGVLIFGIGLLIYRIKFG